MESSCRVVSAICPAAWPSTVTTPEGLMATLPFVWSMTIGWPLTPRIGSPSEVVIWPCTLVVRVPLRV